MALADRLRTYAQECLDQAKAATDEELRGALLQNAESWLRLAIAHEARHCGPTRGGGKEAAARSPGPTPVHVLSVGRDRLRAPFATVPASAVGRLGADRPRGAQAEPDGAYRST